MASGMPPVGAGPDRERWGGPSGISSPNPYLARRASRRVVGCSTRSMVSKLSRSPHPPPRPPSKSLAMVTDFSGIGVLRVTSGLLLCIVSLVLLRGTLFGSSSCDAASLAAGRQQQQASSRMTTSAVNEASAMGSSTVGSTRMPRSANIADSAAAFSEAVVSTSFGRMPNRPKAAQRLQISTPVR